MCQHRSNKSESLSEPALSRDLTRRDVLGKGLRMAAGLLALGRPMLGEMLRQGGAPGAQSGPSLDVALKAARWIRTARIETANGVTWPADPAKPASVATDLYNGMPGVVLFHLELYYATGDRGWLDDARAGASELAAQLPVIDATGDAGLYTGLAGAAFVLEQTHRASGEGKFRDAAVRAVGMIQAHAQTRGGGVGWTGESATNDIISGSAGIGLFLLWADQQLKDSTSRATAVAAGRALAEQGIPSNGGLKWAVAPTVKNLYPNFSHGTAGVSYFLATLYQATGDRAFLDAALRGAAYLRAVANTDGNALKVFHHEPGGEELFYLSWCHGPAGLSRLFYRLGEVTHDDQWLGLTHRAARAIIASGVPEQRTPGFWNNISQCCGNAGVGEYFLWLNRLFPDPAYADMTRRIGADTLKRATAENGGLKWVQAENRVQPDVVVAQTGFMQGAAGVGTLFLHLDAAERSRRERPIVWPDAL